MSESELSLSAFSAEMLDCSADSLADVSFLSADDYAERPNEWWNDVAALYRNATAAAAKRKFGRALAEAFAPLSRERLVAALKAAVKARNDKLGAAASRLLLLLSAKPNKSVLIQAIVDELIC